MCMAENIRLPRLKSENPCVPQSEGNAGDPVAIGCFLRSPRCCLTIDSLEEAQRGCRCEALRALFALTLLCV